METWRGTPDSRIRGFAMDSDVPFVTGFRQSEDGSNGTSAACEAKLEIKRKSTCHNLLKQLLWQLS